MKVLKKLYKRFPLYQWCGLHRIIPTTAGDYNKFKKAFVNKITSAFFYNMKNSRRKNAKRLRDFVQFAKIG